MCLQCLRDLWLQQADQFLWLPLPSDLYLLTTFPATYWCYDFLTYPAGYNLTLQSITLCPQLPITLSLSCFLTLRTTDLEFHQDFPSPCPFVVLLLRIHHKLLLPSFAAITVTFTSFSTPCELSPLSSLSRGLAICCWEILVLCYVNIPGSSALSAARLTLASFFPFSSPLSREIVFLCIHHNSTWSDLTSFPFLLKQSISTLVFLISPSLPNPAHSHHETLSLEVHCCAVYKRHHLFFFLLPPHTFSLSSLLLSHWSFFKLKSLHITPKT